MALGPKTLLHVRRRVVVFILYVCVRCIPEKWRKWQKEEEEEEGRREISPSPPLPPFLTPHLEVSSSSKMLHLWTHFHRTESKHGIEKPKIYLIHGDILLGWLILLKTREKGGKIGFRENVCHKNPTYFTWTWLLACRHRAHFCWLGR